MSFRRVTRWVLYFAVMSGAFWWASAHAHPGAHQHPHDTHTLLMEDSTLLVVALAISVLVLLFGVWRRIK